MLESSLYYSIFWSSRSSNLSFSHLCLFCSCFKVLLLSLFSSLSHSLSKFESLWTLNVFYLEGSFFTVKDDDFVLPGSLKPEIYSAVFLQTFEICFQVLPGILFSCFSSTSLVMRLSRYIKLVSGFRSLSTSSICDFLKCSLSFHHSRLMLVLTSWWSVAVDRPL